MCSTPTIRRGKAHPQTGVLARRESMHHTATDLFDSSCHHDRPRVADGLGRVDDQIHHELIDLADIGSDGSPYKIQQQLHSRGYRAGSQKLCEAAIELDHSARAKRRLTHAI